jgi:hypothetical protein
MSQKFLYYPSKLAALTSSPDTAYTMFYINSDVRASKLKNDKSMGDVYVDASTTRTSAQDSFSSDGSNGYGNSIIRNKEDDPALSIKDTENRNLRFKKQDNMTRLDRAIVLPMPSNLIFNDSVHYGEEPANLLSLTMDTGADLIQGGNRLAKAGNIATAIAASYAASNSKTGTAANSYLKAERKVFNPRKEQVFNNVDFRTFNFQYTFSPTSRAEADSVQEIIKSFRYYSMPFMDSSKLFYLTPAEFVINFMLGSGTNTAIPRIMTSVLTNVTTNLTPNNQWANFENGFPPFIDFVLTFKELETLNRDRIEAPDGMKDAGGY